jgi:hypothetical protein
MQKVCWRGGYRPLATTNKSDVDEPVADRIQIDVGLVFVYALAMPAALSTVSATEAMILLDERHFLTCACIRNAPRHSTTGSGSRQLARPLSSDSSSPGVSCLLLKVEAA